MSAQQLVLAPAEPAGELELVDGTIADEPADVVVIAAPAPAGSEQRNLFGEAERIAARAASASTRRQYASIFRAFGDWLAGELGRPPVVGDLDTDVIAAYGRYLAVAGGRGGRPAAPATTRVYVSMIRALAHHLGREDLGLPPNGAHARVGAHPRPSGSAKSRPSGLGLTPTCA